ncbi:MAG: large conductance mechanosensitive channel protein MscL [Chryseobacterium sp.]|nr:MAG: large conductance mechanosensitive channel protein MscL [Chryseobacterium sp.]
MAFLQEFKEFALKGNVVELAVAVIIGQAFGNIVNSFVEDVITPLLLNPALKAANVEHIQKLAWNGVTYGNFLAAVINFLCIAFVLFIMIKGINRLSFRKKKEEEQAPAAAEPTKEELLLAEIRDILRNKA